LGPEVKNGKQFRRARRGGGACCYNRQQSEPGAVPDNPKWEIPVKDNQARLQLFALAYNLANFLRRLALPRDVKHWSLATLREKLVKIGAKVTRHAKYVTFQLSEVAITRKLFAAILDRIERLALPPPIVTGHAE
jgi:hypothetical protein